MADLPKRELGRTGRQVTMLGYGAMELRGVPRGREVTEAQAETFDVFQIPYSAVEREHEAVITAAAGSGAGIVIRGGAAKGAPSGEGQTGTQWERWRKARLDDLLEGMTPREFILRFTFTHPDMATNIVGTINAAHLQNNINALRQGPLPPDLYAEAKRRLAAAGSAP